MRKHNLDLESVDLTDKLLESIDCVVISTDHDAFDWDLIQKSAGLIIDPRGKFVPDGKTIFRA